jgi:sporulation protein YlmC with PRC-barrel domain
VVDADPVRSAAFGRLRAIARRVPGLHGAAARRRRRKGEIMNIDLLDRLKGTDVVDPSGDKIGSVEDIYLDDQTHEPEWLLVNTGLFGMKSTFVPLQGATPRDDDVLCVQFDKDTVKDAPNIDPDRHLSAAEQEELYRYYGLAHAQDHAPSMHRYVAGEPVAPAPVVEPTAERYPGDATTDRYPDQDGSHNDSHIR